MALAQSHDERSPFCLNLWHGTHTVKQHYFFFSSERGEDISKRVHTGLSLSGIRIYFLGT